MIELTSSRKNKIHLEDYDYQKDIRNRILLSQLNGFEASVLEEILYSPLKFTVRCLARSLEVSDKEIIEALEKLKHTQLFQLDGSQVFVDKDMRKYFESAVEKMEEDFKPDMDYLFAILKKVPIHVLPTWYSIPRTSNHIFSSILEKYMITPQTYQRYFQELFQEEPVLKNIVEEVIESEHFEKTGDEIREIYNLDQETFEKYILLLEFNLVLALSYKKVDDQIIEIITPFHEWKEYLSFLRNADLEPISDTSKIKRLRPSNFAFIDDMNSVLQMLMKKSISKEDVKRLLKTDSEAYVNQLLKKMEMIKLIDPNLKPLEPAHEWIRLTQETRALNFYRHAQNALLSHEEKNNERKQREAEKSIKKVLDHGWVKFSDFIKCTTVALTPDQKVMLKQKGKTWKYTLPEYTESDRTFIKAAVFEGLFEAGMVAVGEFEGEDVFCVTPFGQTFFGS